MERGAAAGGGAEGAGGPGARRPGGAAAAYLGAGAAVFLAGSPGAPARALGAALGLLGGLLRAVGAGAAWLLGAAASAALLGGMVLALALLALEVRALGSRVRELEHGTVRQEARDPSPVGAQLAQKEKKLRGGTRGSGGSNGSGGARHGPDPTPHPRAPNKSVKNGTLERVKQLQDDLDRVGVETMPPPVTPPATPSPVAAGPPRESHDIRARPETKATGGTPVAG